MAKPMRRRLAWGYLIPVVLLLGVLAYSLVRASIIYTSQTREQNAYDDLAKVANLGDDDSSSLQSNDKPAASSEPTVINQGLAELQLRNGDFVGWLSIKDTIIDYPVMKSSEDDPEFYLRRDFNKNDALAGSLFIGAGCTANSDAFIIYGHKMSTDTMFGTLDYYSGYDFANKNQLISFKTPYENRTYRVFAAFQAKVLKDGESGLRYYDAVGDLAKNEYEELVQTMRAMSLVDIKTAPTYPQQLLMLSTCSYHTDDGRFVVVAYRES